MPHTETSVTSTASTSAKAAPAGLRIVNKVEARQRRPVTVETWTMDPMRALDDSVYFFSVDPAAETEPLQARLVVAEGGREAQLELDKSWGGVRGTWKAAVFDADGVQSGLIQISL